MNVILHNISTAVISQGSSLTHPSFPQGDSLKTFDFVVAGVPFSDKRWSTGLDPLADKFERFKTFGAPPAKQGDYAYLLHLVRSLKSTGKGACILSHGVLFRGNAEADIRRNLVTKGYIKGIIGLPAKLYYGTGIPACVVVIDKEHAATRKGIFPIDASGGFMKDGPKNRLRACDRRRSAPHERRHGSRVHPLETRVDPAAAEEVPRPGARAAARVPGPREPLRLGQAIPSRRRRTTGCSASCRRRSSARMRS